LFEVVPAISLKIVLAAALGIAVKLLDDGLYGNLPNPEYLKMSFAPFTALGVAISLFLGFHNNASYGRWWEARILWGAQIISVRNIIRFVKGSLSSGEVHQNVSNSDWANDLIRLCMAQSHAFRAQMRPYCAMDGTIQAHHDRDRFLTDSEIERITSSHNPANAILHEAGKIVGRLHRQEIIDTYTMIQLSKLLDRLCDIQTACERIQNTSLPIAYSLLVHRTATIFVILAPFAIVDEMKWWTPIFTAILAYTFFGLDELARQIQEPFGDEPQCLALSAMCRTIEMDVCEALGRDIPSKLKPRQSIVM
jgi:ion channel-forming bestrophin family protein